MVLVVHTQELGLEQDSLAVVVGIEEAQHHRGQQKVDNKKAGQEDQEEAHDHLVDDDNHHDNDHGLDHSGLGLPPGDNHLDDDDDLFLLLLPHLLAAIQLEVDSMA